MPSKPRFFLPDMPVHIVIRGNNRQVVFVEEEDYLLYLEWLGEGLEHSGSRLHAYVLMSNHVQPAHLYEGAKISDRKCIIALLNSPFLQKHRNQYQISECEIQIITCLTLKTPKLL
jgi:hypothetical protein